MTAPDLRETLAERLYCLFVGEKAWLPTEAIVHIAATKRIDSEALSDQHWRALADECIRQMEWARRTVGASFGSTPEDRAYLDEHYPLTAAPNDWKPK
jgi:hypothetical protein